jgi:3-oxoacyl-[acyl-carrier-protein] synthase-3
MRLKARLIGQGSALPTQRVTNTDLEQRLNTTNEWIVQRTGIKARHIASEGQMTSDLAIAAAEEALQTAGISATALDTIILATTTPDRTFPATATKVQAYLGAHQATAFDLQAVCSGFIFGLSLVDSLIRSGSANNILVIGAETMSRLLDWNDRSTAVLFGDGAGAFVFTADKGEHGILSVKTRSDGRHTGLLCVNGGVPQGTIGTITMNGREVFRHAVTNMHTIALETLAAAGHNVADLDWLVPHQANARIIENVGEQLGIAPEKVILTVEEHGNTSAASVPLAFYAGRTDGRIQPGNLVLLEAMGAGFTWGACLIKV